jgi:hypothetical protein
VKLLVSRRSSSHARELSKELIAELESRLGNAKQEYLTIGISYKHSVFPTSKGSSAAPKGLSYHAITMRIEAHAVIKRHGSESSWSHHTNGKQDSSGVPNPLFSLIDAHYDSVNAARIKSNITSDAVSLSEMHRRELDTNPSSNSSSDTITSVKRKSSRDTLHQTTQLENSVSRLVSMQSLDITQAGFHDTEGSLGMEAVNPCRELDPARKIWLDMRKTSRGTGKRGSPATENLEMPMDGRDSCSSEAEVKVQKEQVRIMELALRNKRSVGADTLRSMAAPSMLMDMGMGRSRGWGPPWW